MEWCNAQPTRRGKNEEEMKFFDTHVSPRAMELVAEALRSGQLAAGERVRQFEDELARLMGLVHPVAVNSGTSALHLALVMAGVGQGDEVILPAQSFIGSGFAIVMCGARPVFSDIQPLTGTLDPASLRRLLGPHTKAVMPVHWGGYPCDLDEINAFAGEHGLAVIEDAAHALGATYKGRAIGAVSRFTAFSFGSIKHLTTGDGGALCCFSEEEHAEARRKRWFGVDIEKERSGVVASLDSLGFKYHMNDLAASVGLGNLPDMPENLKRRRDVDRIYREQLGDVPGLTLFLQAPDRQSACWLFSMLVDRRDDFISALAARGVPAKVVDQRIDGNRIFGGIREELSGQKLFDERYVCLPMNARLTDAEIERVVAAVRAGW